MAGPSGIPASTVRGLLRQVPAVATPTQGVAGLTAHRQCRWIDGEPKPRPAFCGAPAVLGCSWCEGHRRRAFVTDMRAAPASAKERI